MTCRCYYCGQETDRPIIFSLTVQRVFNYIWDHPGCSSFEISDALHAHQNNVLVNVQLSQIRKALPTHGFRLVSKPHPNPASFGFLVRRMMTHRIIRTKPLTTESSLNATP